MATEEELTLAVHARNSIPAVKHVSDELFERTVNEMIYAFRSGKATYDFLLSKVATIAALDYIQTNLQQYSSKLEDYRHE